MKIQIENLKAQMRGVQLNNYQKALALDEYYKLLDYVNELEQLTIPAVVGQSEQFTCDAENNQQVKCKEQCFWCKTNHKHKTSK